MRLCTSTTESEVERAKNYLRNAMVAQLDGMFWFLDCPLQLSEGHNLCLSWGAGALLDIIVLLAGTGESFPCPAPCSSCQL